MISKDDEIARLRREVDRLAGRLAESERQLAGRRQELSAVREFGGTAAAADGAYPSKADLHAYLMEHAPLGIMLKDIDDDFRYVDINSYAAERLGVVGDEGIGKTDFDWLPCNMARRLRAHDLAAVKALSAGPLVQRHVCKDGFTCADGVWREWLSLRCILAQPGCHRLLVVCSTEITILATQERKAQEAYALAEAERDRAVRAEQAEAFIAESLRDVMSLPPDQDAMETLLCRVGERLQADRCYVYTCSLHEDAWVTDRVYEWCAEGIPSERENLKRKGPPGLPEFCDVIDAGGDYVFQSTEGLPAETRAWFERRGVRHFFSTPITDVHGVSIGYLGLDFMKRPMKAFSSAEVHNIHEVASIVKLCLTRQKALETLRDEEKAKETFFAAMSHDIRTPLNSIIGFSQLLKTERDEAVRDECLNNIIFSGDALIALVNDMLEFFRSGDDKVPRICTKVNLPALVHRVLATFLPAVDEKGVKLTADMGELPLMKLDEARVRRVLFNLVGNAVKFTDQGEVSVRVMLLSRKDETGTLRIVVRDTGVGISPHDIDKIMQPYVRIEKSSAARGGTGLGLTICRRLVEKANGTVAITSKPEKGTTVVVTVPDVECYDGEALSLESLCTSEAKVPKPRDFSGLRVLVVDDLEMNRCVLVSTCRRLGVGVVDEAKSGFEALDYLKGRGESLPDVILTDLKMPVMDGCELMRRIRGNPAWEKVPVCLVTADVSARKYVREAGAFDILLKPVLQSSLSDVLFAVSTPASFK